MKLLVDPRSAFHPCQVRAKSGETKPKTTKDANFYNICITVAIDSLRNLNTEPLEHVLSSLWRIMLVPLREDDDGRKGYSHK